ncbi:MAG: O-antigen ligase family protein, partial [Solirubrobacteraceae bacterium]
MAASTRAPAAAERRPARFAARARAGGPAHPESSTVALVLAATYAAFSSGATRFPQETRLELLLVVCALGAVLSWAGGGGIRWRASRAATVGLALLALLAAWSALSLLWSITPDRTWLEANRTIAYALVVALALAVGASHPRAIERTTGLVLASAALVALYAFGTKALPGLSIGGLFDLDQAGGLGRLRAPLGYWNATALVCALGVPITVRVACDMTRRVRQRALALGAGLLFVCVIGLTYSRGGLLAVGVAATVLTALGGARLRGLAVIALLALASLPVLAVAFSLAGTADNGVPLAIREHDGRVLLLVFLVSLGALLAGAVGLWRIEARVRWTAARTRAVFRVGATLAAFVVLATVAGLAVSDRGLPGSVSDRVSAFTEPSRDDQFDPGRLVTTTSGNRWVWWKEAVGAWSDRPVGGWGAGSYRATHLRYRLDELSVTQAHSVPLQLLAETGFVGLALFAGGVGALGVAAARRVAALPVGRERDLAVAGLAAVAAWVVHGFYDWDWNIPGATLPALILLGVLAGAPAARSRGPAAGSRVVVVAGAALVLSLVAASAVLPGWADGKASDAQVAVSASSDETALREAAAEADLAARLDPLALRPLLASATIARRRGRLLEARRFLLEAVARQPESAEAWLNLAGSAFELADRVGFERAALRALTLDPRSARARGVALAAVAFRTPPGVSATAGATPLAPAPVQVPSASVLPVPATGTTGTTEPGGATGAGGTSGPGATPGATGADGAGAAGTPGSGAASTPGGGAPGALTPARRVPPPADPRRGEDGLLLIEPSIPLARQVSSWHPRPLRRDGDVEQAHEERHPGADRGEHDEEQEDAVVGKQARARTARRGPTPARVGRDPRAPRGRGRDAPRGRALALDRERLLGVVRERGGSPACCAGRLVGRG